MKGSGFKGSEARDMVTHNLEFLDHVKVGSKLTGNWTEGDAQVDELLPQNTDKGTHNTFEPCHSSMV